MAFNKFHTFVAVIGIAAIGTAAWWYQRGDATERKAAGPGSAASAAAGARGPGAAAGGGRPGGGGGGPVAVELGKVEVVRLEDDAQAVGSLRAAQTVVLRPEVSGRVVRIGFADGERVKRGQLLVQLDDTVLQAQLRQAEAQASIARTNLQRSRELQAQNFVAQSAVDQNAAALEVAEAQVALARAQLSRLSIRAPFDGLAGIKTVAVGDYVKDGADLVALEDRSSMWVEFRLPERFVGQTKTGQSVQVLLDALPDRKFTGKVQALDSLVDANGRSLLVRARIDQNAPELKSGMFARARVLFAVRERSLLVPEEALVPQGGKQYLIMAIPAPASASAPAGKDNGGPPGLVSKRIEAKLGLRVAGKVEILEGLAAGDRVVTAGQARLMRGDSLPLRVVDLDKPPGVAPGAASGPNGGASRPAGAASGSVPGARTGAPA